MATTNLSSLALSESTYAGSSVQGIFSTTTSISWGAVGLDASTTTTIALAGATPGCSIDIVPGSNWSGAYLGISHTALSSATNQVIIAIYNSGATVTPAASTYRITATNF